MESDLTEVENGLYDVIGKLVLGVFLTNPLFHISCRDTMKPL